MKKKKKKKKLEMLNPNNEEYLVKPQDISNGM